jgi:hypothetical protein
VFAGIAWGKLKNAFSKERNNIAHRALDPELVLPYSLIIERRSYLISDKQRENPMTLDQIRSKPNMQLTKDEIAQLSDQEQRWVMAQLVRWIQSDLKAMNSR